MIYKIKNYRKFSQKATLIFKYADHRWKFYVGLVFFCLPELRLSKLMGMLIDSVKNKSYDE
jgi:hypothetical protein